MNNQNELITEINLAKEKFISNHKTQLPAVAIKKLFTKFPLNNKAEDVLLKATVINSLYSTNIYDIIRVAENIVIKNIDGLILQKDLSVIDLIAFGHGIKNKKGTERRFYSFATKYCHFHNGNEYPIYDSYVELALASFKKEGKISFKTDDLRSYDRFKAVIIQFRDNYDLNQFSIEEIDHYLWLKGKSLAESSVR